ncbi:gliding motility protein GldM [Paraflavitalea sp. CAU 1676]|uniref:type IX secretion system motor protein PorM/GldM n=1 Tax=Paraflavitalea sp. CAU 1676 TaxID=3032598 RepID=UPI0023DC9AC7|nr:gliding motility protein GldM [Paraflavitalea sp. CAU 1676]MDF2187209.1 gliding motility protein GldM [Paraflavitalea sp. CAU 1676]
MGLPKEPRQKMINMMYLVLTALLALNVSSEILNAFKVVNVSIDNSIAVINDKNKVTYESFDAKKKDPQTAAKAAIWAPKAEEVKKITADLFNYIEGLKLDVKKKSKLEIKDGVEHYSEDNLDAPTALMDKEGKGKELYDKLTAYKKNVIGVLKPEEFADNPAMQAQLKKDIDGFNKTIPINMNVPKSQSGKEYSNDAKGWTTNYFHMTPTVAALTILGKFQNDIKSTEAQMVDYLHNQIGSVKIVFDQFQAIAQANTSYAMPGDAIEITAGVGAFSAAAKPKIFINGAAQTLDADGTAKFKTTASGTGDHAVDVRIEYAKPDGSIATVNKKVNYTVGIPSGASVFLEKMNVLYVGVDNPLTISGGSVGSEKVKVSFSGGAPVTRKSGDSYSIKPTAPGMAKINVVADGKPFEFPMRVKFLPPPTAFVGTKKSGSISSAELKAIGAVIAKLDSDFEAPYKVVSYKVGAVGGPIQIYAEAVNSGNRWSGPAESLISRTGPGTRLFFDAIQVVGPDGRQQEIPSMVFQLK